MCGFVLASKTGCRSGLEQQERRALEEGGTNCQPVFFLLVAARTDLAIVVHSLVYLFVDVSFHIFNIFASFTLVCILLLFIASSSLFVHGVAAVGVLGGTPIFATYPGPSR